LNLQAKIIYAVIIITTSLNLILEVYNLNTYLEESETALNNKIELSGKLIQKVLANPIYNIDSETINENILIFFNDPEIKSIRLLDYSDENSIFLDHSEIDSYDTIEQRLLVDYRGLELAEVEVVYTKKNILDNIKKSIYKFGLYLYQFQRCFQMI
jgi:hypothetical protein